MPFTLSSDLLENDEVEITTDANGDLAIRNKANGNTVTVDEDVTLSSKADQSTVDTLSTTVDSKADQDGGGTASLDNYGSVNTENLDISGWDWVDIVNAGADPTGTEDAGPVLNSSLADNTLIICPPGTYHLETMVDLSGLSNVGIWSPSEAVFTGDTGTMFDASTSMGENILFENLTQDATASGVGGRFISALVPDGLVIRNITVNGKYEGSGGSPVRADVTSDTGMGLIERVSIPDGMNFDFATSAGILIAAEHRGAMRVVDCHIEECEDGLYASNGPGSIHVEGGTYRNSAINQVRIGGDNGSSVRDAFCVVDSDAPQFALDNRPRGLRVRYGTGHQIENVTVSMSVSDAPMLDVADEIGTVAISGCHFVGGGHDARMIRVGPTTADWDHHHVSIDGCSAEGTFNATGELIRTFRPATVSGCSFDVSAPNADMLANLGDDSSWIDNRSTIGVPSVQASSDRLRVMANRMTNTSGGDEINIPNSANATIMGNIVDNGINNDSTAATAANNVLP